MAKSHNPSMMRTIRRELKEGKDPEVLLSKVKSISDSYYLSLSLFLIIPHLNPKNKSCKNAVTLASNEIDKVQQPWRRIELLGSISKLLKSFPENQIREKSYSIVLKKLTSEKKSNIKDFLINHSKNFPENFLEELLVISSNLESNEFETGKAIIRHWAKIRASNSLVESLQNFSLEAKTKLLGYLHLQIAKSRKDQDLSILPKALESANSQELLLYLVRVCSSTSDIEIFEAHIINFPLEEKIAVLLSLTSRADRKNFKEKAKELYIKAEENYSQLKDSEYKLKFRKKLDLTLSRLEGIEFSNPIKKAKNLENIPDKGNHTLALYNTYGGNWNHPHFKSIFKASNLCAAFELDLALINFPDISSEKLIKEIKKELRLPNEGYIKLLFDKNRVRFFNNEIDESWSGNIVATTASPDQSKASLPGGRICMVMGLGPKGLPKSFINKAAYHFELTGSDIAFETGTAMGAISAHLGNSG